MKIEGLKMRLLNAEKANFLDKQGKEVNYSKATMIVEGKIMELSVASDLITSLIDVKDKEGIASLDLTSDFKNKPKIKLIAFK